MLSVIATHALFTIIVSVTGSLMWRPTDAGRMLVSSKGIAVLYSALRPELDRVRPALAGMNLSHSPPRQGGYRLVTALCSQPEFTSDACDNCGTTLADMGASGYGYPRCADAELEAMPHVLRANLAAAQWVKAPVLMFVGSLDVRADDPNRTTGERRFWRRAPAPRPTPFLPPSDPSREPSPEAKMRLDALEKAVREGVKDPKVAREIARRLPSSGPSTSAIVTACNMRADEIALDLPRRRVNA